MSPTNETVGSQSSSSGGASDQGSSSGGSGDQAVKQTAPSGKSDQSKRKGKQLLESIENPPVPKQVGKEGGQDIAAIVYQGADFNFEERSLEGFEGWSGIIC